jgi:hypothetical protein
MKTVEMRHVGDVMLHCEVDEAELDMDSEIVFKR